MPSEGFTVDALYRVQSPTVAAGAIGLIEIIGDVDAALSRLGVRDVEVGGVGLRKVHGGDESVMEMVVARRSYASAHLMPHAGLEIMRGVVRLLREAGIGEWGELAWSDSRVASEGIDAALETALSRAASPLAVDVLVEHASRWRRGVRECDPTHAAALSRLIEEPLVAAWGPPNVGKSTLLNALANERVSIVADEPGTTRDHVGAQLDLSGLIVRYVDTPGVRPGADTVESDAVRVAQGVLAMADLVLWLRDASSERPDLPPVRGRVLCVDSRADLGVRADAGLSVTSRDPASVRALGLAIREALVPREALEIAGLWAFWRSLG